MTDKFTRKTPIKDILVKIKQLSACSEAIAWYERYAGETMNEVADNMSDIRFPEGWAVWGLVKMGEAMDSDIRRIYISKIKDPMTAFNLYLGLKWLTDEEDKLLETKFKGKLPTAESELTQSIVTREKI
jgi:hypothetical protein